MGTNNIYFKKPLISKKKKKTNTKLQSKMSQNAIKMYRSLLRHSKQIPQYNFREYALRSVRTRYRENLNVTDTAQQKQLLEEAERNLELIKRQATIGKFYAHDKNVIEPISK